MGDPRKFSNRYERPKKLWERERLKEEGGLKRAYGLKTMRELWMMGQELKKARRDARKLLSLTEEERRHDMGKLMGKLQRLGILPRESKLEDVLSLSVKDILERRLQTRVVRKGLAKTMAQSRQLITHGFIAVGGKKVSAPSYLVSKDEEEHISYFKPIDLEASEPAAPAESEAPKEAPAEAA